MKGIVGKVLVLAPGLEPISSDYKSLALTD